MTKKQKDALFRRHWSSIERRFRKLFGEDFIKGDRAIDDYVAPLSKEYIKLRDDIVKWGMRGILRTRIYSVQQGLIAEKDLFHIWG